MRWLVLLVACTVCAPDTSAQTAPPDPPPPAGTAPAFVVQSDDGDNRLQIGALVHADGRFLPGDSGEVTDAFVLRRFRSILQGRLARHFEYFLNVEMAGGNVQIRDAYVDTRFADAFRVRVGKARVPFSYDRLVLIVNIPFVERGFTTTVAPDRDTGVQVLGDLARGRVSYGVSLTNGVVDGQNSDTDTNNGKDVAGRLMVRPWFRAPQAALNGLGFAVAANTGTQSIGLPSFPSSGRQTYFAYAPGVIAEGRRTRWSPQLFYQRGPVWAYGEWVRSRGGVRRSALLEDVDHDAWQVAGTWVLTGEAAPERNVRPRVNFDPATGHWGALQLVARYQALGVSGNALTRAFAATTASRHAHAAAVGLNWYPNPFVKWQFNYERTTFEARALAPRPVEHAVLLRMQLGF